MLPGKGNNRRDSLPKDVACDNSTNFVGESNELNEGQLEALDTTTPKQQNYD